jgi:hypothetical protein
MPGNQRFQDLLVGGCMGTSPCSRERTFDIITAIVSWPQGHSMAHKSWITKLLPHCSRKCMVYEAVAAETRVDLTPTSERVPPALGFLTIALNRVYASKRTDGLHVEHSSLKYSSNSGAESQVR